MKNEKLPKMKLNVQFLFFFFFFVVVVFDLRIDWVEQISFTNNL